MSDNLPPGQPGQPGQPGPSGPPPGQGGPFGPPPGQPGQPTIEHLHAGAGQPLPPAPKQRGRARPALVVGGVVLTGALIGGGVWAWAAWFNQGPQPSEALPSSTLAYLSVDLDPSGEQKVEAIRTLRKFPAFKEEVGLDTEDDVRQRIFEEIQKEGTCKGLDYGDDIEPWLGDRIGFAFVKHDQDATAAPVVVLQVDDEDKAGTGLEKLAECAGGSGEESGPEEFGGYAANDGWVVLAETEKIARAVADDAKDEPLSEDGDFKKWTEAAGDPGIVTMYAAPEAGAELMSVVGDLPSLLGGGEDFAYESDSSHEVTPPEPSGAPEPVEPVEPLEPSVVPELVEPSAYVTRADDCGNGEIPEELRQAFEEFPGGAGTVRFDDGNLEIEFASGAIPGSWSSLAGNGKGAETLGSLPDSTAVALGAGFAQGWVQDLLDQIEPIVECEGTSMEEGITMFESETGLSVPEDVEALGGESFAIAFDGDFHTDAFKEEDITRVPVGAKIKGDPEKIEAALDKLRDRMGPDGDMLLSHTEGDHVVVSASSDYLDALAESGDLGSSNTFQELVPERDGATAVVYVDFDASDNWLDELLTELEAPKELRENVSPLEALGVSSWKDGEESHSLLKVTTD